MTKVDIFSGFLGAGKTTLIKKLIEEAYGDEKLVLIENEFGEIGVDGAFLKDTGIRINEMSAGCICCSLVGDFGKALNEVIETYAPDRILIEPSGVGKLSDVITAVRDLHNERIVLNGAATVVDAKKAKMYMKNFGEFFNNQIENASSIILSHTSGMPQEKLDQCERSMREHNASAEIVTTSWDKLTGGQLLEVIEGKNMLSEEMDHLKKEMHGDGHACRRGQCHKDHDHCEHDHDHHAHDHGRCHHSHEHCEHDHDHGHCEHDHGRCSNEHDHGHVGHHHADEVFNDIGVRTSHRFSLEKIEAALGALKDEQRFGAVLRAKGIVESEDGGWIHFDYVPGEPDVRNGSAAATGMICVIGAGLNTDEVMELFGLEVN